MDSQPALITTDGETAVDLRSRFRAAFFSVAPAMFLGSIDQTIVAAALPVIARSVGGPCFDDVGRHRLSIAATVAAPSFKDGSALFSLWQARSIQPPAAS